MLNRTAYFIREHAGVMKLTDVYDILDPATREKIGEAVEEIPGWSKALRLVINKGMLPTDIRVYEGPDRERGRLVFSIHRGVALLRSRVEVLDAGGRTVGYFRAKMFSVGGAFQVFTAAGEEVALVKGDWKGWNFRFLRGETELGRITKEWAGLGRELFTSADNYIISLNGAPDPALSLLLLAAGLAVDTVFKESE